MSKLYGPDEGYQTKVNRGTLKRLKKGGKSPKSTSVSYLNCRSVISELISDQEPVLSPPWNPVIDLNSLTHDEFVQQAQQVMTTFNTEGHPPPGVNAPSMKVFIDRLELAKQNDRASYASVLKSVSMKEPKKVKEVSFYPNLDMETRSRETQYAVATVHSKMTPRLDGKRQCKGTERLGDFFSGKKTLATSQDKVDIINDINPIERDGIELFEDDDDEVDELEEYYQHKEQCAIYRASMVRGKNSMVPEAADYGNAQDVVSHNSLNSSSNGEQDKKKRRTAKSYFTAEETVEESKTQSTQLSTQELPF
jgi:hypothetical protein